MSVAERIRAEGRRLEFTAELLSALLQPPDVGLEALGINTFIGPQEHGVSTYRRPMRNFAKFAKATNSICLCVLVLVFPEQRWYFKSFYAHVHVFNLRSFNLSPEAEFLNKIHTKVLRVFLLAIHSHLYTECTAVP